MANITFSPVPGTYLTQQSVSAVIDPAWTSVIFTTDGTAPTLAKYIAYDNLAPANPFIAVVQDGKGNAVFDGGFPKWYNASTGPATTFVEMNSACKYLANVLQFIANPAKIAVGNKKVLFIGDANSGESYNIKDVGGIAPYAFRTTFDLVCSIMGYVPTYKTRSDYGVLSLDPNYAELDQYCCVVVMSSVYALKSQTPLITPAAVSNITAYREAGNGIFLITDHGVGVDGFYTTANHIAVNLGVTFANIYDRTPIQVGFLRATYGDHPLYANLLDTEYIPAGASESKVVITQQPIYTPATVPNISTTSLGISTIRFLLVKSDGTLVTSNATYAININEPVKFTKQGAVVTTVQPQFVHSFNMTFVLDNTSLGVGVSISGLMKVNGMVVGTFSGTAGLPVYSFYSGINDQPLSTGINNLELEVQMPVQFFKTLTVPIIKEPTLPLSLARITQKLNRAELACTGPRLKPLKQTPNVLGVTSKLGCSSLTKSVRTYVA
jgi:hypothetical protein